MKWKMMLISSFLAFSLFFSIGLASGEHPVERPSPNSGGEVYKSNCAGCHGEKGDGPILKEAFDFNDDESMITKNSSFFFDAVTNGIPGTSMPSFGSLSPSQRWNVVAYLWTFWTDNAGIENGRDIYKKYCASCHGQSGDGSGITDAVDFTNVSLMADKEPETLFKTVSNGVKGTSMPSWKDSLSENERWNTVKYIWTFQFEDYPGINQPPVKTPSAEIPPSGEPWYFTPAGMGIVAVSIILGLAVLYLFGKGMQER